MSAAPVPRPRTAAEGWPPLKNGYCQVPHWLMRRARRITANAVEADCLRLILDETVGWHKDAAVLAIDWFAKELDVTEKAVRDALLGLADRGFVKRTGAKGEMLAYSVDLKACEKAPDYKPPVREPVKMPEPVDDEIDEEMAVRPVDAERITFYGKELPWKAKGRVVAAENKGLATVARCGECETVGIFEMISTPELEFRTSKQKAKVQSIDAKSAARSPQARGEVREASSPGPVVETPPAPSRAKTPPGEKSAGPSGGVPQERIKAIQRALALWKEVFGAGPQRHFAARVGKALGNDAPIELFVTFCRKQKGDKICQQAKSYAFFEPLAREFRKLWERDQGHLCPQCKATRLRHGDVCACSTPSEQRAEPPPDEYWSPIKTDLKKVLPKVAWENWIGPTWLESAGKGLLKIGVASEMERAELSSNYLDQIRAAVVARYGAEYEDVEFVVRGLE